MRIGQRRREDGMRGCEVVSARTLSSVGVFDGEQEFDEACVVSDIVEVRVVLKSFEIIVAEVYGFAQGLECIIAPVEEGEAAGEVVLDRGLEREKGR